MSFKDECQICGRVFRYTYLKKCERCRRSFCKDCMVPDISTGDISKMFCLNCARKIVSPKSYSKYIGLTKHLKFRASFTNIVKLSFAQIDGLIGDNLPMSAYKTKNWWKNTSKSLRARAWIDAGWEPSEVNLEKGYVVFHKVKQIQKQSLRERSSPDKHKRSFTPAPARKFKPKKPSKTKLSKMYAKIKNLERKRLSMVNYHGSLKPKSAYEKRSFKPEEKPD